MKKRTPEQAEKIARARKELRRARRHYGSARYQLTAKQDIFDAAGEDLLNAEMALTRALEEAGRK